MDLSILQQIDNDIDAYRQHEWPAMLPFKGHQCYLDGSVPPPAGNHSYQQHHDLFEGVRNSIFKNIMIIRFDPIAYPISNGGWKKNSSGEKLITALCTASQKYGGCDLVCNGCEAKKKRIYCPHHRAYDSSKNARQAAKNGKAQPFGPVRSNTYHCDRNNTRGKLGKSMKKRTVTSLSLSGEGTCKVRIILEHDHHTYFLRCGDGNGTHSNHTRMDAAEITTRSKFINESMMDYQKELAVANIGAGQTAAAVNTRFGMRLTRRQVAYHQGFAKLASSLTDANEFEETCATSSDLDIFIQTLKKMGAGFCALYHRNKEASKAELPKLKKAKTGDECLLTREEDQAGEMLFTETGNMTGDKGVETACEIVGELGLLGDDMMKYARESRVSVNADNSQDVLLAIVWVLPHGKHLFRAYPEVMFIDGTHKTNEENRPLITMGIKDCSGKMQIILRAFVPNERAWLFRWLFQVATPSLLGKVACASVQLLITDGDSQETSQLDQALKTVFKSSQRRRCGWHIVEKGWDRNVAGLGRTQEAKHIETVVKHWIYSLMKEIETDVEYSISKALLLAYVQSSSVSSIVGFSGSNIILKYLRSNVFPHEDNFAGHHYNFTRSFNEYSNTCLEGTNNGLKYNSDSVIPSMGLAKAGKSMLNQDERKASDRKRSSALTFNGTPLYTISATSRYLQPVAETMLQEQQLLVEKYASLRISYTKWYVAYSAAQRKRSGNESPRPMFARVRIVTLNGAEDLRCSCGYTERYGVPCRHLMHVAVKYGNNFNAFSHHQVAVRFWQAFDTFVAVPEFSEMDSLQLGIRNMLWQARCRESGRGTLITGGLRPYQESAAEYVVGKDSEEAFASMNAAAATAYFHSNMNVQLLNYSRAVVDTAVGAMETDTVGGLTQETYNADDHDDSNSIDFEPFNQASFNAWQAASDTTTAYQAWAPRLKELASLCEHDTPEEIMEVNSILDDLIQKKKARHGSTQTKPAGQVVSALAPTNHPLRHAHTKQKLKRSGR